jgi:nucleotide-binding universal stress UspA family protein
MGIPPARVNVVTFVQGGREQVRGVMFNRILVALKFGAASEFALLKGVELARRENSELHIFHALDYVLKDQEDEAPLSAAKAEAEDFYDRKVRPLVSDLRRVTFDCEPADPALEVCKRARRINADLIILGCHQKPDKMCLGRIDYVGMTIFEKAPCPVMLVPLCE